jgi:CDP-diacylglycerol--serine O-phosphatidyltransferase
LSAGLTSIRFTFDDILSLAAGLLILAAFIDGVDGQLARRLNAESQMGAELDSLSDFVCFGVAPALLVYRFGLQDMWGVGWVAALFLAICCCLRLARFNVMSRDPEVDSAGHFTGIPAPAGAMLALFPVFLHLAQVVDLRVAPWAIAIWTVFVGAAMISRLRTLSIKSIRVDRDNAVYVLLGASVVGGLMLTRLWLFAVGAVLAYILAVVWGLMRDRRTRGDPES